MKQKELRKVRSAVLAYLTNHPKAEAVELLREKSILDTMPGRSWQQMYNTVGYQLKKVRKVREKVKKAVENTNVASLSISPDNTLTYTTTSGTHTWVKKPDPSVVGVIADTHFPWVHPDYMRFCQETFKKYGVNRVVHIGDEVDNYALSYHQRDPNGISATSETNLALSQLRQWYATFPNVDVLVGNHSALPHRQATTAGIPKRFVKAYEDVWEAPAGWKWHMELEIDGVKYIHGLNCLGATGALDKAIRSRQSVVIGHSHSNGGVQYHASSKDMIFGMNVGCGVNQDAYAFDYAKDNKDRWTLGCGIVIGGKQAVFVPMHLTNGRWQG